MSQSEGDSHSVRDGVQEIYGIGDISPVPRSEDNISSSKARCSKRNRIPLFTQC